jgi:hypothetical protein
MTTAALKMLLASAVLLTATRGDAADRFGLSFFSLVPPPGWWTESDKHHRLVSGAGRGEEPPILIIEACSPAEHSSCPRKCDLPAITESRVVSDLHFAFKPIKRRDDYVEYGASSEQAYVGGGKAFTAVRLLCGPAGFIYAALMESDPSHASGAELDAVIDSIEWSK